MKVFVTPINLWEMQAHTDLVVFIDLKKAHEENWTDDVIDNLDTKYPIKKE